MTTTYTSIISATSTGGYTLVGVPPYIHKDHIKFYVGGIPTQDYVWQTAQSAMVNAPNGVEVMAVRRTSPTSRLVDYTDGQDLPASALDTDSLQAFYMAQEAYDAALLFGSGGGGGLLTQDQLLALLNGQISRDKLSPDTLALLEQLENPDTVAGSVAWRIAQQGLAALEADKQEAQARAAAIQVEATNRAAALAAKAAELRAEMDTLMATVGGRVSSLEAQAQAAANDILNRIQVEQALDARIISESEARTTADSATASTLNGLIASVEAGGQITTAKLVTLEEAFADKLKATVRRAEAVRASLATGLHEAQATILQESNVRATADEALASQLTLIDAAYKAADSATNATIVTESTTRASADSALASQITAMDAAYKAADATAQALLVSEQATRANADSALTTSLQALSASLQSANSSTQAALLTIESAFADRVSAAARRLDGLRASVTTDVFTAQAGITSEQIARANADSALASQITAIDAAYKAADTATNARLLTEQSARSSADSALASQITTLDAAYKAADTALNAAAYTEQQARASADEALADSIEVLRTRGGAEFSEMWNSANSLTSWVNYSGSGERAIAASPGEVGGAVLRVGNNSGNDMAWLISTELVPFDPSKLYRLSFRVRQVSGSGTMYLGVVGVASDGVTLVNTVGAASVTEQHYVAASGLSATSAFTDVVGYLKGRSTVGHQTAHRSPTDPAVAHQNVRYIRPMILVNYKNAPGVAEVGLVTVASGATDLVTANVLTEASARTAADSALSTRISALDAAYKAADSATNASLLTEQQARVNAVGALSQQLTALDAAYKAADTTLSAAVTSEQQARASADSSLATQISALDAAYKAADAATNALVVTEQQARASADSAMSLRIDGIDASYKAADATINANVIAMDQARASGDAALATSISSVQASVTNATNRVATVETTQTALVADNSTVKANYTLKVVARTDGKYAVAGIGLNATQHGSVSQSDLILYADKINMVSSAAGNGSVIPLFGTGLVNGANTFTLNALLVGDKTVEARMIVDGGIEARHMKLSGKGPELNQDPNTMDASAWASSGSTQFTTGLSEVPTGASTAFVATSAQGNLASELIPLGVATDYIAEAWLKQTGATAGTAYLGVIWYDSSKNYMSATPVGWTNAAYSYYGITGTAVPTAWTKYTIQFGTYSDAKIPTGAAYVKLVALLNYNNTVGSSVFLAGMRLHRLLDSSLIVKGGIKADRVDTRGLTIKDMAGNVVFSAGVPLASSYVNPDPGWLNSNATTVTEENSTVSVPTPRGGTYNYGAGNITGALKITLPQLWTSTMMRFRVDVFDFAAGGMVTYDIAGYNYSAGSAWLNVSATMHGAAAKSKTVRFGHDGTKACVWIGDTTSVWAYPKFKVHSFFGGFQNATRAMWETDWALSVVTTLGTVQATVTNPRPGGAMSGIDQITPSNASTYIANASIGEAQVGVLTAQNLTVSALSNTVNGGVSSGGRVEITNNRVSVYDTSGILRVKLGYLL